MTCEPLPLNDCARMESVSMSSVGDSHARMCRGQEDAPALPESVRDSTGNWCEPFAWFDRNTRCWKTWQRSLETEWELFSETWPRAGVVDGSSGIAYRRKPSAPLTNETAFGLLPTPTAAKAGSDTTLRSSGDGRTKPNKLGWALAELCNLPTPRARMTGAVTQSRQNDKNPNLETVLARRLLPTPTASDWKNVGKAEQSAMERIANGEVVPSTYRRLRTILTLPTPRASDADNGGRSDLLTVLRGYETRHAGTLPTPTARDWRSGKASKLTHAHNYRPLNEQLSWMSGNRSGHVNPRFLEWMMGLPTGWSELAPLAIPLSRKYRS